MNQRPDVEELGSIESQDEGSTEAEASGGTVERAPRARARRPAAPVAVSPFGGVPAGAQLWGLQRATLAGAWEACNHPDGEGVRRHEWPIGDLSIEALRDRWGAGTYRVQWFRVADNGGRKFICCSSAITVDPPAVAEAQPVASAQSSGSSMREFVSFMDLVDSKTEAKIAGMANLARLIGGQQPAGLSGSDLMAALREERAAAAKATADAIAAAVAPLHAKLEALGGQGGQGGGIVDAAAKAAAPLFGEGTMGSLMAFASSNPEVAQTLIEKGAPIVQGALSGLLAIFASSKPAAPPAPAQRPRAQLVQPQPQVVQPQVVAATPAAVVEGGSLSSWKPAAQPAVVPAPAEAERAAS
jgi:hypothetical protein